MIFSNTIFGAIGEYCVHYIGNISLTKYGQSAYRHSLFQANNCLVPICVNCVYCVNCTKFGLLVLRIIIKIDANRCQILRLKCTKIVFGWGSAPDPAGGAYDAPPDPLVGWEGIGA